MRFQSSALLGAGLLIGSSVAFGTTVITNTRPQIAQMAGLWEVDSVQISPLANAQYPQFTSNWEYTFPGGSRSSDGDQHINMGVAASGNTGSMSGNQGESPIVAEIINATDPPPLSSGATHAKTRGIFRLYTEHSSERKYEIHPMTEWDTWTGSNFVVAADFHNNIAFVTNGTTHAASTLQQAFTQSM